MDKFNIHIYNLLHESCNSKIKKTQVLIYKFEVFEPSCVFACINFKSIDRAFDFAKNLNKGNFNLSTIYRVEINIKGTIVHS